MPIPPLPVEGSIAPADYTVKQFDADILDIILRFPDNVNPVGAEEACVYETEDKTRHCLIGQWLFERGHTLPRHNANPIGAKTVLEGLGYPLSVCVRSGALQYKADNNTPVWRTLLSLPK